MIYVDPLQHYPNCRWLNKYWCHMATDQNELAELHEMADKIGLPRKYFQSHPMHPHYDLYPSKRRLAIANGALACNNAIDFVNKTSRFLRNRQAS